MYAARLLSLTGLLSLGLLTSVGQAGNVLISEIFFNPPGANDVSTGLEYIELCGLPNHSLDNHFLIFLENENDEFNSQNPGEIENIFNLTGMTLGSNGFAVLAMRNSPYPALSGPFDIAVPANPADPTVAESRKTLPNGAHAYVNRDTGNGFGNGVTSSIGHVGQNAEIEGSGFTAMLIYVEPGVGLPPVLNDDLDVNNNGLDHPTGRPGWTILDSIGVFGEFDETAYGRLYAQVNFGPGAIAGAPGGIEPGAAYVNTWPTAPTFPPGAQEIEYVGRVGNGHTVDDWMAANLTNNAASGFTLAQRNYAISGTHATLSDPEVFVGTNGSPAAFPYGTDITVTFGERNVGFEGPCCVPEPGSFVMLSMGALGLGVFGLRRRYRSR